jgi:hypothetical protein
MEREKAKKIAMKTNEYKTKLKKADRQLMSLISQVAIQKSAKMKFKTEKGNLVNSNELYSIC